MLQNTEDVIVVPFQLGGFSDSVVLQGGSGEGYEDVQFLALGLEGLHFRNLA